MGYVEDFKKNINNKNFNVSKFLTPDELATFKNIKNIIFFPDNCERKRIIITNDLDYNFNINEYISVIKITYNKKFGEIGHKDVLGSLMALGIKRECIGDIIVVEDIYVYIIKEMINFIFNNLITIGKVNVNVSICDYDEIKDITVNNYFEDIIIVSSYRLDAIISERCGLSRDKSKQYISLKNVKINGVINTNSDYNVKIDDLISIHKYGRMIIKEEINKTKKDKYVLKIIKTK